MGYLIHLQKFEGPLGLLLYLIRKEEMDIFDININEITKQYLDYIRMMKELDLEVAGEFVAMAATLIHIKSRMLLPQYDDQGEVVEQEDPRKELVQKLLEYQRFQEASKKLYGRPLLNRDVFPRGVREDFRIEDGDAEIIIEEGGLFALISHYRRAVKKAKKAVHSVRAKMQSIASRIMEISDRLVVGQKVVLRDLITAPADKVRGQLLITFLSVLELGRMGYISVFQNEVYGDIYIEARKPVEGNVMERVQEFDSADAEEVAKHIMEDALEEQLHRQETAAASAQAEASGQLSLETQDVPGGGEPREATDEEILAAELELGSEAESHEMSLGALELEPRAAIETIVAAGELAMEAIEDLATDAELEAELALLDGEDEGPGFDSEATRAAGGAIAAGDDIDMGPEGETTV